MRSLARAVSALLVLASSGCASGWLVVRPETSEVRRPEASSEVRPAPDWSALSFTVAGPDLQRWALLRTLRLRYGVVDARAGQAGGGACHLEAIAEKRRAAPELLAAASFLTFAAVPGVWVEEGPVRTVLSCPDGATAEARGTVSETWISWAPFLFLGPTLLVGINGGVTDVALERADAAEALAVAALAEFEPVLAARAAARTGVKR